MVFFFVLFRFKINQKEVMSLNDVSVLLICDYLC